jgi:hypothetical protein
MFDSTLIIILMYTRSVECYIRDEIVTHCSGAGSIASNAYTSFNNYNYADQIGILGDMYDPG